jgi:hypothetical protein
MNNTKQNFEQEIEQRLASDQWDLAIARKVLARKKRRIALLAGAISLAVAGFSFFIISVTLQSPTDTELASLLALQINTSYELAGGANDTVDDAIDDLIALQ